MPPTRPNVVIVVADDMGYSDLGCYGGEIATPTLDRLGRAGVRLTRFYNTTRCSPSRASMLTGLHPHQTGIGILTSDDRPDGYRGSLNERCLTLAEMLREAGYATCLSGKWHLTSDVWNPSDAWPTRRGFDRFFGTLSGCGSYYRPTTLTRGEQNAEREAAAPGFFYTDAITRRSRAVRPGTRHTRRIAPSSSIRRTPRRTGRCMRRPKMSRVTAESSTPDGMSSARARLKRLVAEGSCLQERP